MEKRSRRRRFKRIILVILSLIVTAFFGAIAFSPYGKKEGFAYKLVKSSMEIDAPADSVFKYLGNSANASKWSVFVRLIKPLNSDSFPDGTVGGRRRCYNPDGMEWDELITEVVSGKKRQLVIYNLKNFPLKANNLATEQIYKPLGKDKCRVDFTVFYKDGNPTFAETIKTYFAAYKIKDILDRNLSNIKRITEKHYADAI